MTEKSGLELYIEENIRKTKKIAVVVPVLLFFALLIPVLAFFGFAKPDIDIIEIWFQRSGAFMSVFSIVIDALLISIAGFIHPTGLTTCQQATAIKPYVTPHKVATVFGWCFTIIGTAIWGYGDLLYKWVCNA